MTTLRSLALTLGLAFAGCDGNMMATDGGSNGDQFTGSCSPAVTFADVKTKVFKPSCIFGSCHDAAGHMAGLDLVTNPYGALVNQPTTLDTAKADFPVRVK